MSRLRAFHLDYLAWTLETHGHRSVRHTHALCDTLMLLSVTALLACLPPPLGRAASVGLLALTFVFYVAFDAIAAALVAGLVAAGLVAAAALARALPGPVVVAVWAALFVASVSAALLSHVFVGERVLLYPPSIGGARRIGAFAVYGAFLPFFGAYYQATLLLVDFGGRQSLAAEARRRVATGLAPLL
jgi:hypothetical protein